MKKLDLEFEFANAVSVAWDPEDLSQLTIMRGPQRITIPRQYLSEVVTFIFEFAREVEKQEGSK